jgi:hypothetical protein
MEAGVVEGVKLAAYVSEGDGNSFQGYFSDLARSNIGRLCYANERHGYTFKGSVCMVSAKTSYW